VTRRLALALSLVLAAAGCSEAGLDSTAPTTGGATAVSTTVAATPSPGIAVIEVRDGDTFLAALDGGEEDVRLLGINAPERDECFGDAARAALADLLDAGPIRLEVRDERDQYGRLLAYVYAGEVLLNVSLVSNGFALAVQEDHALVEDLLRADERAFTGGLGLWAADACGTPSSAPVTILDVSYDPAGPDEDDLNGEWVLLGDLGDQDADLGGWTLRDESSQNRYLFPTGTVLTPGGQVRIHTGCGDDSPTDLYWCASGPVWNNGGDTVLLLDPQGNVAGRLRYSG
jgi:endonuclease YncB( thermonuclease family)